MSEINPTKILLTGGSGFLGRCLLNELEKNQNYFFHLALRENKLKPSTNSQIFPYHDLNENQDWSEALNGCEVVVHLAARVHIMKENSLDPLAEFRKTNVEGTLNLARQAAKMGIKRFIFLSSIKVNGEFTSPNQSFKADDTPKPEDAYGISKYEAEQALLQLAKTMEMDIVIIRAPLIYGPQVKGNLASLINLIKRGLPLPLPFKSINNKRSFVSVDNLINIIETCFYHPKAKNQIFLVSDGHDLSTQDLLKIIAENLNKKVFLFSFSPSILFIIALLFNKKHIYQRLCGSLQIDINKTCDLLEWQPPFTVYESFKKINY